MNSIDIRAFLGSLYDSLSQKNQQIALQAIYGDKELNSTYFQAASKSENEIVAYIEDASEFLEEFYKTTSLCKEQESVVILSQMLASLWSGGSVEHQDELPLFTYTL